MSFLRPQAIPGTVRSFLLWFQMVYAVWQFIRTAKFFRLFYVLGSSLWHGLDSWIKRRKLILMLDDLEVDKHALVEDDKDLEALRSPPPGMTADVDIDDYNVEVSFTDPSYTCLTTRQRAFHMLMLHSFRQSDPRLQFARDDDLLLPNIHLIRRLTFEDAMDHVLSGKGYEPLPRTMCFFDYSSRELLNQNFVRFASIWPLMLQARHFDFWSIIFSIVIILMDLFSYFANKLWKFVQYWVSRLVKWVISVHVSDRERRVFCFTFMATISTQFECRNFVAEKACSLKVVKEVLLATHTKFDKRKVAKLYSISIPIDMQEKIADDAAASRNAVFVMNGEKYTALATPALTDGGSSSVHFHKHNIKVKDWALSDMAYFLQVCDYCNKLQVSPVKELDGRDAVCCSFAEIVHGVKSRIFVVCEFKAPYPSLFFT